MCDQAREMESLTEWVEESYTHKWWLQNFNLCSLENCQYLPSFTFPKEGEFKNCFYLDLYPRGDAKENEEYISLCVYSEKKMKIKGTLSLFYNNIEETTSFCDTQESTFRCFPKFIERNKIFQNEKEQNKTLLISCTINFVSSTSKILEKLVPFPDASPNGKEHFAFLNYDSSRDRYPDVELVASDETVFPAHRLILASHSKVFEAMFQHDMKEKQTGRVEIANFKAETVHVALQHTYSGLFSGLSFESALEVLQFADVYDLPLLRKECANFLYSKVSVENVLDQLVAADDFNCSELKESCLDFISLHLPDILNDQWKTKLDSRPDLLLQILQTVARDKKAILQSNQ